MHSKEKIPLQILLIVHDTESYNKAWICFFHSTPLQPQISQDNNKGELIRSNQSPSRKTPMMLVYEAVALGTGLTDSLWLKYRVDKG